MSTDTRPTPHKAAPVPTPDEGVMPPEMPPLATGEFVVRLDVLETERGTLLVEAERDTRARWEDYLDDLDMLDGDPAEREAKKKTAQRLMDRELALFARVRAEKGPAITTYQFVFRAALLGDVANAESVAADSPPSKHAPRGASSGPDDGSSAVAGQAGGPTDALHSSLPLRLRPQFRAALASATFLRSDYPLDFDPADWSTLRADIAEYVLREVERRTRFSASVRDFLD